MKHHFQEQTKTAGKIVSDGDTFSFHIPRDTGPKYIGPEYCQLAKHHGSQTTRFCMR